MSIDTKALRALCPLEWQGKGRHDIYGTEGCEFAQFGNLEHSVGPAGFEVYTDREDWFSTFWHGNRGHQLGRFASQGDAKKAAQAHADKLVASFAPALLDAADRIAALEAELDHERRTGEDRAGRALAEIRAIEARNDALEQDNARLRRLLGAARCPNCDGSGAIPHGPTPAGDWEAEQCQWCYEKQEAIAAGGDK